MQYGRDVLRSRGSEDQALPEYWSGPGTVFLGSFFVANDRLFVNARYGGDAYGTHAVHLRSGRIADLLLVLF